MVKLNEIYKMKILESLDDLQSKTIKETESCNNGGIIVTNDGCYLEYSIEIRSIPYEHDEYAVMEVLSIDEINYKISNGLFNKYDEIFRYGALDYNKYIEYTKTIVKEKKEKERLDKIEGKKKQIERLQNEIKQLETR